MPIKSIASLHIPPANELKVLVGGNDCGIKVRKSSMLLVYIHRAVLIMDCMSLQVWNFNSPDPALETTIKTDGSVEHIDISDNSITWATFEPIAADQPMPVGMLTLMNMGDIRTFQAKVCVFCIHIYVCLYVCKNICSS